MLSAVTSCKPLTDNQSFINIYTGDPETLLCDEIINYSEGKDWDRSKVIGDENPNLKERDSHQQSFTAYNIPEAHKQMMNFAGECLKDYLQVFPHANKQPRFSVAEHYNVIRYLDGGAYHAVHTDYYPFGPPSRRHLTGVCFLNDVKEGGQLVFPQQEFFINSEAGKFIIFPSGWTHAHNTLPPIGKSRYVFQLWWSFDSGDSNGY